MKKIIMLLSAITLGLTSCEKFDEGVTNKDSSALEKTSVVVGVVTSDNKTSKNVKRTTEHAWVSKVNLTATLGSYVATGAYDLITVGNSAYSASDDGYILDAVAIGTNDFNAVTETSTIGSKTLTVSTNTPSVILAAAKLIDPYAIYTGSNIGKVIVANAPNSVLLNMNTEHGKIVSVFQLGTEFKTNGYFAVVTATVGTNAQTVSISGNEVARFYWSDNDSKVGSKVTYSVIFKDKNEKTLNTYTSETVIKASTTINCTYTITSTKINLDGEVSLIWAPWKDENCTTCDDDGGDDIDYTTCVGAHGNGQGYNCCGYQKETGKYNIEQDADHNEATIGDCPFIPLKHD